MRSYYRVMLGKQSTHADDCFIGNFIGADYEIHEDLTGKLSDEWRDFNAKYIPVFLMLVTAINESTGEVKYFLTNAIDAPPWRSTTAG